MKTALTAFAITLITLLVASADEVDRDSKQSKDRPHLLVIAQVEKVEVVEQNPNEPKLMTARIRVERIDRHKDMVAPDAKKTMQIFFRTGLPQRPRLPVLQEGQRYKMYLRTMKVNGGNQPYLEFEDDAVILVPVNKTQTGAKESQK